MRPDVTESSERRLCRLEDVPDGGALEVRPPGDETPDSVLLLRLGGQVQAFHNVCPHAGRALNWAPGRFLIDAGLLVCAAHGATFSIPDGRCVGGPCRGSRLQELALEERAGELHLAPSASVSTSG
jgi:nitrite reductase/ring-hydroxylating ferredoxin subunit